MAKTEDRNWRASWNTKLLIWGMVAGGWSNERIQIYCDLNRDQQKDLPRDRTTISKIRNEFSGLRRSDLVRAITEAPTLRALLTDGQILGLLDRAFRRSAFETPICKEASIQDFKQAIEDTKGALRTGLLKTRDDETIEKVPDLNDLRDQDTKRAVERVVQRLDELLQMCTEGQQAGKIRECGVVWVIDDDFHPRMEDLRRDILSDWRQLHPDPQLKCLDRWKEEHPKGSPEP